MAKQSGYLKRLDAQNKAKQGRQLIFAMQYAEDAAMMAAAEVFGMGEERAKRFGRAYCKYVNEISKLIFADSKDDKDCEYSRAKIDQRLSEICGKYFQPWEVRYNGK